MVSHIVAMRSYRSSRTLALVITFLGLASCATTGLPPIGAGEKPFQMEEDERYVWRHAEQIERQINHSGILYEDYQLEAYLNAVAQKLVSSQLQASGLTPRIRIIKHPLLNAFALPNGTVYLHTGMLARMENEAQLATVLGHEMTHFLHRHTVKEMRSAQNQVAFLRVLQVMLAAGTAAYGGGQFVQMVGDLTGQLGAVWALASVRGYSRELETEADEEGLKAIVQAGYNPQEAPRVFELLRQELDEQKIEEPFFFGTHPRLQERIDNYRRALDTQYVTRAWEARRVDNTEEFLSRIDQLLLDNAVLDMSIGRFKLARDAVEKHLQRRPHHARAYFLLGQVHRQSGRGGEPETQRAIAAYQEASRLDPTYADPHRELGLLYRSQSRPEPALAEFERYLALMPQAVDAPIIQGYVANLRPL